MNRLLLAGLTAGAMSLATLAGGPLPAIAHSAQQAHHAVATAAAVPALVGDSLAHRTPFSPNGQIVFERGSQIPDEAVLAVVNPDGSGLRNVSPLEPYSHPHWSPDGTRLAAVPFPENVLATIFNVDTGTITNLPNTYPMNMGCAVWSPDGTRLACASSHTDGSPESAGMYTVRASDGLGLSRVTTIPGGEDEPASYSPNGKLIEFARFIDDSMVGLFIVKLDGSGLKQITPDGALVDGDRFGDWSPQGNNIVFAQHNNPDVRNSIWVVHADGSGMREIHFDVPDLCGGVRALPLSRGCFDATWSPDGKKIAFIVNQPGGDGESVYTANVDGTDVQLVSRSDAEYTDWGTHPLN